MRGERTLFGRRRLERFEARQEAMLAQIGHITTALIVREPGTALSANAYDGLRKQVSIAARDRRQHLARLVELMEAIDNGATPETLRRKCEQWCHESGLESVTDVSGSEAHWFRIVEGDGPAVEVLTPAWVDTEVGHLIQRGTARRVRRESVDEDAEAAAAHTDAEAEADPEPETVDDEGGRTAAETPPTEVEDDSEATDVAGPGAVEADDGDGDSDGPNPVGTDAVETTGEAT
jgi:hypothetical protein